MPCDTVKKPNQTLESRSQEIKKSLSRLETALTQGRAKVRIGPTGAVAIDGWKPEDRDGVTDVCAVRTLLAENSWPLRQAIARAEALAGRKVNHQAIAAGHHAHGDKWHKGH